MAVLAKPVNEMIVIKAEHSKAFIEHLNRHVMTKEMEESCKKAGNCLIGKKLMKTKTLCILVN